MPRKDTFTCYGCGEEFLPKFREVLCPDCQDERDEDREEEDEE